MPSVVVVGAGFSGTLLALHLLRRAPRGTMVKLIERKRPFGCGLAYATSNPSHLLNVRVGGMSAFRDRPDHFLDWLNAAPHRRAEPPVHRASFVPRRDFGAYVRSLLAEELDRAEGGSSLDLISGEVTEIAICEGRVVVNLRERRRIVADLAVIATGNVPAVPPPVADPGFYDTGAYRPDPWAPDALTGVPRTAPVLLIGSGLTAIDVVMSLLDQGHAGPIRLLSRRGLLPQPHAPGPFDPVDPVSYQAAPRALLRQLRTEARHAIAAGGDWRAVIDAIRPFTSDLWQLMPLAEKARFLRHVRPWWDIHRHRMAPPIASRLEAAMNAGQVSVTAGRILGYDAQQDLVAIRYRPRRATADAVTHAARVINCSGPGADYGRIADPLMRSLLQRGLVRPDPLRLGLDVTANCALRGADGAVSRQLFAVGPLTRSAFWEMMAVPDIRRQCELLAAHLAALLPAGSAADTAAPIEPEYVI